MIELTVLAVISLVIITMMIINKRNTSRANTDVEESNQSDSSNGKKPRQATVFLKSYFDTKKALMLIGLVGILLAATLLWDTSVTGLSHVKDFVVINPWQSAVVSLILIWIISVLFTGKGEKGSDLLSSTLIIIACTIFVMFVYVKIN